MRNLKRVLSLSLAFIMLTGLMMVGAGAANYKDESSIKYNEAVDVLSAIGVFSGTDKGEFNPQGDLTRDAAAKIITYMLMGKKAADDLVASSDPYQDVPKDNWAAGSIAYCAQNKIISGDGKGHFFPSNTVTGTQFAKMLLGALGYNAETEKYVGEGYELNIAKQVRTVGLADGLDISLSATLTREQAAQMALNTLEASMVEYVGGTTIVTDGMSIISGGTRQEVKNGDKVLTFMANYFPTLKLTSSSSEAFGRPAHKWSYGAKTVGTYGNDSTLTYTDTVSAKTLKSDLSNYTITDKTNLSVNGVKDDTQLVGEIGNTGKNVDTYSVLNKLTGPGRLVEIYTKNAGADVGYVVTDIVIIDTFAAKITNINTVNKTVSLIGNGITSTVKEDNSYYATLSAMDKDDIVLVTASSPSDPSNSVVRSVAVPETATGTVTSITSAGVYTIGGNTYKLNPTIKANSLTTGTSYTVYLDAYGNVILADADAAEATKSAFLVAVEKVGTGSTGYTYNGKLVFADGTQEWVEVSSYDGKRIKDSGDDFMKLATGSNGVAASLVSYGEKSDGTYSLKPMTEIPSSGTQADKVDQYFSFTGKKVDNAVYFLGIDTDIIATSKTVFLIYNESAGTYKAYTGYKNVPEFTGAEGKAVITANSNVASMVVVTKSNVVAADDLIYLMNFVRADYNSEDSSSLYVYNAVFKGKVQEVTLTTNKDETAGLYTVATYDGDYISKLGDKIDSVGTRKDLVMATGGATVNNGVVSVDGKGYPLADNALFAAVKTDANGVATGGADVGAGNIEYYTATNTILFLNSDKAVTTVIVLYK